MTDTQEAPVPEVERQSMDADIVCVGFGPAVGGFLTTLSKGLTDKDGNPVVESKSMPGMPPQVICYERSDDIGFGVSGVVTKARGIRASFPDFDPGQVPMTVPVKKEHVYYLLDPVGASRRPFSLRFSDVMIRTFKFMLPFKDHAFELPYIPPFLRKHEGLVLSIGQFNQWVGTQLMGEGQVQIWPASPVAEPLVEEDKVVGVRLADQGTDKDGKPDAGYMPGMDIRAPLTVVGDGPVGAVGRKLDAKFGLPEGHHQRDWAVGMKVVVDLPEKSELEPGTVIHTFGYPEPEIFGFMYVYPDNVASLGIFVPSWFDHPVRTSYRYMQHWMQHPKMWKYLEGGTLRSFGAKSLQESGRHGEPHLVGDGFARVGEGSGSTNVLAGSGVDEAWVTGVQLAEGVLELLKDDKPFTKENLEQTYVKRRRESWVEEESKIAADSRSGFNRGFLSGMIGMALTGWTKGKFNVHGKAVPPHERIPKLEQFYKGRLSAEELKKVIVEAKEKDVPLHDALMDHCGWPAIPLDGKLLVSHQDALLMGGKVQATPGYRDHVTFFDRETCIRCGEMVCVSICSGQAITAAPDGGTAFDREKCLHCGACLWNCSQANSDDTEKGQIEFAAGAGGLHSAEN